MRRGQDLVRRLRGVSAHNLYAVLNRTESFRSLVNLDQEAMEQLLGAANGRKVWEFVHRNARRK